MVCGVQVEVNVFNNLCVEDAKIMARSILGSNSFRLLGALIIAVFVFTQGGCDNFSSSQDNEEVISEDTRDNSNHRLHEILEEITRVVDDLEIAYNSKDKQGLMQLFNEFQNLENEYQVEFDNHMNSLSMKDANFLSTQHSNLVRKATSFSSMLR